MPNLDWRQVSREIMLIRLYGFTEGCGVDNENNPLFCPLVPNSRAEAAFFLRRPNGNDFSPASPSVQPYDDILFDIGALRNS
jgi:hypothetical protein